MLFEHNAGGFEGKAEGGASRLLVTLCPHRSLSATGLVTLCFYPGCIYILETKCQSPTFIYTDTHTCMHHLPKSLRLEETEGTFARSHENIQTWMELDRITCSSPSTSGFMGQPLPHSLSSAFSRPRGLLLLSCLLLLFLLQKQGLTFPTWSGQGVFLSQDRCISKRKSILSSWDCIRPYD